MSGARNVGPSTPLRVPTNYGLDRHVLADRRISALVQHAPVAERSGEHTTPGYADVRRGAAILATDYRALGAKLAAVSRWSQENFFRYMRQSYHLDELVDYGVAGIPETTILVNPAHRTLDGRFGKPLAYSTGSGRSTARSA
jgi:hypothetical protein